MIVTLLAHWPCENAGAAGTLWTPSGAAGTAIALLARIFPVSRVALAIVEATHFRASASDASSIGTRSRRAHGPQ